MAFTQEELAIVNELTAGLSDDDGDSGNGGGKANAKPLGGSEESGEPEGEASEGEEQEEETTGKKSASPSKHAIQRELIALRRAKGKIAERERESEARINSLAEAATKRLAPFQAIADAAEGGDWDSLAEAISKAIGGDFKDWNGLNRHVATRFASPDHRELVKLRRVTEEREKRDQEERAKAAQQAQESAVARQREEYVASLGETLANSDDEIVHKLSSDKSFLQQVFQEQQAAWDPSTETTIEPEVAAKRAIARVRKTYEAMRVLFGDQAPNPEYTPPRATNSRNVTTVPGRRARQASPPVAGATEAELTDFYARQWQRDMEELSGS